MAPEHCGTARAPAGVSDFMPEGEKKPGSQPGFFMQTRLGQNSMSKVTLTILALWVKS